MVSQGEFSLPIRSSQPRNSQASQEVISQIEENQSQSQELEVAASQQDTGKATQSSLTGTDPQLDESPPKPTRPALPIHFIYKHVPDIFYSDLKESEATFWHPGLNSFGLIPRPYDETIKEVIAHARAGAADWRRLASNIEKLNEDSPENVSYHLLWLGRHGQGYHNLAEEWWGTHSWDAKWSLLDGDPDSDIKWADADLTRIGREQAAKMSADWDSITTQDKMPFPQRFYVSPMTRACKTAQLVFQPLVDQGKLESFKPEVKEMLRETMGIHTCDRRSTRSTIAANFPEYNIEDGFTEKDELWDAELRETLEAHTHRAACALDDILNSFEDRKASPYISITSHGGMINAICRAVGHKMFSVGPGKTFCLLIKAEKTERPRVPHEFGKGQKKPELEGDPYENRYPQYDTLAGFVEFIENHYWDGFEEGYW